MGGIFEILQKTDFKELQLLFKMVGLITQN